METHLRVAIKLLEGMGYLRGAVMKVGQILANLPTAVPDEIIEAARIDGASELQVFRRIIVPSVLPATGGSYVKLRMRRP